MIYFEIGKAPTSKWMLPFEVFSSFSRAASPVCRQERHFYLCLLFLLSRKFSNAINNELNDISKPITPSTTIMVSYTVIHVTSLPRYSGKPDNWVGMLPPRHGHFPSTIARTNIDYHFFTCFSTYNPTYFSQNN